MKFLDFFKYTPPKIYEFTLPDTMNNLPEEKPKETSIYPSLSVNLDFLNTKFNTLINSDIIIKEFSISIKNVNYSASLIFVDGLVDNDSINNFILEPLFLKNSILMKPQNSSNTTNTAISRGISVKKVAKFNLEDFIYNSLIPQNSIKKAKKFEDVISKVNSGFCALFVDTLDTAFCIETRDIKSRSISTPQNENVIKGPHEAFIENLRTNTAMIRKIINNENLIIEESHVGKVSQTQVAICYMQNITNDDLVAEVKNRVNNLDVDYITASGQLEQLIQDNKYSPFPQLISTERPDKVSNALFEGKVVILVNGSPFALIAPAIFLDFLTSPEDNNLNPAFANFLRFIRSIALVFSIFLPGLYVAITIFHQELLPSELLFAIASSREAIPFPVIFEILLMEISFELIREAGLRISSSFSATIGIIGALVLGEAAVSANIVSPILIIIVAFTGICSFAIPDFTLGFSLRLFRFMYIILGYLAGFLGIAFGFFIHFLILNNLNSFGASYFTPFLPVSEIFKNSNLYMKSIWQREKRDSYLNTKRPVKENKFSMLWRKHEQ